jgi:DNA-binding SARP family transcriptional activator
LSVTDGRWFNETFPDRAALVILHPNYANQHLLWSAFLDQKNCTPVYVALSTPHTDLRAFWELLATTLREQVNLALPPLDSNASPQAAAKAFQKTLRPLGRYQLLIEAFDLADQEPVGLWINALLQELPEGCQIVLGGRRLPITLLNEAAPRDKMALYPLDGERMLLDYVAQPTGRTMLEVYGHGPGRVLVNGRLIDEWDGVLPRSLFFYFIDRGMVTRDEIFHTFWPTLPVREATNVFHVTKRKISEILGFDLTVYWSGFYRISSDIDLHYDVIKFVESVQNSAVADSETATALLQRAIYLYHGVFLSSLTSSWVEARREELQSTYVEALSSLARLREHNQQNGEALGLYLRAAATQPQREDLARSIMSLYHRLKQPRKALETFDRLTNELSTHLGVTPDRRTIELAEQIRTAKSPKH